MNWKVVLLGGIAAVILFGGGGIAAAAYVAGKKVRDIRLKQLGSHLVEVVAAGAFERMQAAAKAAGITLTITSGFRTMEKQTELYNEYQKQLKLWNEGKRSTKPTPAARPGYSNHQNGTAIDIAVEGNNPSSRTYQWLAANAPKYGFTNTAGKSFDPPEYWHWEFKAPSGGVAGLHGLQLAGLEGC